jgi:hypothetical protein
LSTTLYIPKYPGPVAPVFHSSVSTNKKPPDGRGRGVPTILV